MDAMAGEATAPTPGTAASLLPLREEALDAYWMEFYEHELVPIAKKGKRVLTATWEDIQPHFSHAGVSLTRAEVEELAKSKGFGCVIKVQYISGTARDAAIKVRLGDWKPGDAMSKRAAKTDETRSAFEVDDDPEFADYICKFTW